jgi:aspartate/methionine/tyrosine aminotransferase
VLDCSATPLQYGAVAALSLDPDYYAILAADYQAKRDYLAVGLAETGFEVSLPVGAYFIMAGIRPLGFEDDFACCKYLAAEVGVVAIPPSAFYSAPNKALGQKYVRFAFCKTMETLERARERLLKIK